MALVPINKFISVDREQFKLVLYKRKLTSWKFKRVARYKIAVGAKGYETPRGLYLINTRAKCPEWLIPDSPWAREAGLKPGTIVPGCHTANPLKARWLGITDPKVGVGIHGTGNVESIGSAASHGCIRMRENDVIELFDMVPKYTPIYIV
jgi:lipoprotein-anchoring transpeptidase ErfK/SrfK